MAIWVDFKEIKQKISIVQVLDYYGITNLTDKGVKLVGPCPIHNGDSPQAFHADKEKNIWHCFSKCKRGGNILDFVALKEKIGIREAALKLQSIFLDTDEEEQTAEKPNRGKKEKAKKKEIINPPLTFTLNLMAKHPYLLKERNLKPETIERFGIGYCSKGVMAGHIAVPVHNEQGELVAYAGRRIKEDDDKPKYKFPTGFQKQYVLYNLHRALKTDEDYLILVEGFFDVFRLYELGYPNAVALMGSSISELQQKLLIDSTDKLMLMLDNDEAGLACTEQAIETLAPHLYLRLITLPDEHPEPDLLTPEALSSLQI